jgi:hypothetical protein
VGVVREATYTFTIIIGVIMHYLAPIDNETMIEFFDRVHRVMKVADNNGEKRPKLGKMFRKGYKMYCEDRKRLYWEKVAEQFENDPDAGTREGGRTETYKRDANGKVRVDQHGIPLVYKRNPGSRGGVSSTVRHRNAHNRNLKQAKFDGYCKACHHVIKYDKARILCVDPREAGRKYVAVICKSCSQGENIRMHTRAGNEVWERLNKFEDSNVRAWIRYKLATLPDHLIEKFREYVLMRLQLSTHPKRSKR